MARIMPTIIFVIGVHPQQCKNNFSPRGGHRSVGPESYRLQTTFGPLSHQLAEIGCVSQKNYSDRGITVRSSGHFSNRRNKA